MPQESDIDPGHAGATHPLVTDLVELSTSLLNLLLDRLIHSVPRIDFSRNLPARWNIWLSTTVLGGTAHHQREILKAPDHLRGAGRDTPTRDSLASAVCSQFRQIDQPGACRGKAGCTDIERPQLLLKVHMEPLTPRRLGFVAGNPDETNTYAPATRS